MSATETFLREPAIQAAGWALLHFVWQGALVGVVAALALRALRNSGPDVRYVVGTIALAVMATLPVVTGVQAWRSARAGAGETTQLLVQASSWRGLTPRPTYPVAQEPASAMAAAVLSSTTADRPLERWLPAVVFGWVLGVAVLALRLVGGWARVRSMKRSGAAADAFLQATVERLRRRLHIGRAITVLQSPVVNVPTVMGWLKPTVLLPVGALTGMTPVQIEAILAHELAHIRRHDYLVNLLQTLVETLLFYHPAVWWISRRIRIEREHCCDDLAVSLCGDPVMYARALADLEELRGERVQLVMAATGGSLLTRVRRLLSPPASHAGRGPAWLAAGAALMLVFAIVAGPMGRQSLAAVRVEPGVAEESQTFRQFIGQLIHVLQNLDRFIQRAGQTGPAPAPPVPPVPPAAPPPAPAPLDESVRAMPTLPPASAALPDVPLPPAASEQAGQESSGTISWSHNGEKLVVEYRGAFTMNDTDSDIVTMSPGAMVRISDGGWLRSRSIEFTADGSGTITRRYYNGRSERPFEPEGREWLAQVLPKFVRQSALFAKDRVARFLKTGGVDAVLGEISQIEGGYGKRIYFTQLLRQATIDGAAARRVLEQAGREIDSDYELATMLIDSADRLLVDDPARKAYFDAARTLESDYEMRRVHSAALKHPTTSPALIANLLDASRGLDSDYEAASLLLDVVKNYPIEGQLREPFFAALDTIDSSYEKGRVLQAAVRRDNVSAETLLEVVEAAGGIESDYESAQVLVAAARSHTISGPAREAYIRAADRLGNHERDRSLAVLARNQK